MECLFGLTASCLLAHPPFQFAYVDGLERDEFFHFLFEDDTEAARLALLPGEKERLEE